MSISRLFHILLDNDPPQFPRTIELYCDVCRKDVTWYYYHQSGNIGEYHHNDEAGQHTHYESQDA